MNTRLRNYVLTIVLAFVILTCSAFIVLECSKRASNDIVYADTNTLTIDKTK